MSSEPRVNGGFGHTALTFFWSSAFALAGTLAQHRVETWAPAGGGRVLVVATHPDDEVLGCAGAILRHSSAGDEVCVAHVTDGRASRAGGLSGEAMAERRRNEAGVAAGVLGVERAEWLGFPERKWSTSELKNRLVGLLASVRPDIVYAPSCVDYHPEHRRVARALARALVDGFEGAEAAKVRVFAVQVPLTSILTNLVADTSEVTERSTAAAAAYATQAANVGRSIRQRRYASSYYRLGSRVEEFWQLSAAQYSAVHARRETERDTSFRGLRYSALTDPLAYLRGRGERRALLELAGSAAEPIGHG